MKDAVFDGSDTYNMGLVHCKTIILKVRNCILMQKFDAQNFIELRIEFVQEINFGSS